MLVTLKNNTNQAKTLVLDHPAFRNKKHGFRVVSRPSVQVHPDGSKTTRSARQTLTGSIWLPAKGEVADLHPAIANCMQVKTMLASGELSISKQTVTQRTSKKVSRRTSRTLAQESSPTDTVEGGND